MGLRGYLGSYAPITVTNLVNSKLSVPEFHIPLIAQHTHALDHTPEFTGWWLKIWVSRNTKRQHSLRHGGWEKEGVAASVLLVDLSNEL